jgi:PAS domain-containing protein
MNFGTVSDAPTDDQKVCARLTEASSAPTGADPNHNSLFDFFEAPALQTTYTSGGSQAHDALSLFDDLDLDKPREIDYLDDFAELIEERSTPMLATVSPPNIMMASVPPKIRETERRRSEAITLLKSLSVPDPLLGQLVSESLTGFIFVVDAEGRIEYVSDSSANQVGHSPDHLRGNPIFNFLHPADHSRFGCHLVQQQAPPTMNTDPDKARRNFTCRFKLLNSASDNYVNLYVACITVRRKQDNAETSRLLCVARKLSDVSPHPLTMVATPAISVINNAVVLNATDLFTTKLDPTSFRVLLADTSPSATSNSRLRASVAAKTVSMVGKCFLDFCHPEDRDLIRTHFLSTVRDKQSVSSVYRMTGLIGNSNGSIHQRLNNVVRVQTKSKYHRANNSAANMTTGFIVSIHSIVGDVPHSSQATSTTTSYLLTSDNSRHMQPLVMMPSSSSSSSSAKVSTLSSLLTSAIPSTSTPPMTKSSSSPPTSSPSPTSENSEEAKNQLLKQLLNSNYNQQQRPYTSEASPTDSSSVRILQLLQHSNENVPNKSATKRLASSPLDNAPTSKVPSLLCSENPNLTELLEKPMTMSMTVPPPVPTKWHQEPREKLPKDIMRKFLPPHPAERAAAAAAAAAAATATNPSATVTSSALYSVLTSRGPIAQRANSLNMQHLVYSSNSGSSQTVTSASTSSNMHMFGSGIHSNNGGGGGGGEVDDKDEMLSEILDGLIDFQERSPAVASSSSTSSAAAVASSSLPMAAKVDENRISDIERFLVSSERSLMQQQQQQQQQFQQQFQHKPKISSLVASSPSLTSILSAPPLATPTGRPPSSAAQQTNGGGSRPSGNPVNLVPRINELLQQVPPNVSIPDTPDLDSLMLLQERRRRMSSGGSVKPVVGASTSGQPNSQQQPRPSPTGYSISQQLSPPPAQPGSSTANGRGQLLMQHLTSSRTGTTSYTDPQPFNASAFTPQPQLLARRSSYSAGMPATTTSTVSPPSSAAAAAAAAGAAAAAASASSDSSRVQQQQRTMHQRHTSGGSVRMRQQQPGGSRRLSDSMDSNQSSDEKQRSLLQQLLSE